MDYFQFRHKAVRDLVWVIASPFLISNEEFGFNDDFNRRHYELMQNKLKQWDENPSDLLSYLGELKSPYLGHYFEKLIFFWIKHDPEIELVLHNLQVVEDGRTLGEVDLIVRINDEVQHWELALKYYLGHASSPKGKEWIGPNPVDRLDLKLKKMIDHQLGMSDHKSVKEILEEKGITKLNKRCFVKGYFYYPGSNEMSPPGEAGCFHNRSMWIYVDQLDQIPKKYALARKEKRAWLCPSEFKEYELVKRAKIPFMLKQHKKKKPQLYALLEEQEGSLREVSSVFIAPRNWPNSI